jgi:hypothetical protein
MVHLFPFSLASRCLPIALAIAGSIVVSHTQVVPAALRLEGLVSTPRTLSAAEVAKLPHQEQTTTDKDGKTHVYRGVALRDVLRLADAPEDKAIYNAVLAKVVLATAADGYQVTFALPEIDANFSPKPSC